MAKPKKPEPPKKAPDQKKLLKGILDAALNHGVASEPDMEVGDLQDALRIAFLRLTPEQAQKVHAEYFEDHETWEEYADEAGGSDHDEEE